MEKESRIVHRRDEKTDRRGETRRWNVERPKDEETGRHRNRVGEREAGVRNGNRRQNEEKEVDICMSDSGGWIRDPKDNEIGIGNRGPELILFRKLNFCRRKNGRLDHS